MHFKITAMILTTLVVATDFTSAWTLTIYPNSQACTGNARVKYSSNDIAQQCFVAGRPGAGVKCQITTNNGKTWSKCKDNAKAADPDKLSFRISKGNSCAWATLGGGCAGNSLKSEGECLKGKDYRSGNEMRFRCMNG